MALALPFVIVGHTDRMSTEPTRRKWRGATRAFDRAWQQAAASGNDELAARYVLAWQASYSPTPVIATMENARAFVAAWHEEHAPD